jgi:hypothetical protein
VSLIAAIDAVGRCGRCGRAVVAAGGCATHENSIFAATECDAQRQKGANIIIVKYFLDANTQILYTKKDEKMALLLADHGYGSCL